MVADESFCLCGLAGALIAGKALVDDVATLGKQSIARNKAAVISRSAAWASLLKDFGLPV